MSSGLNLPLDLIAELQAATETTLVGGGPTSAMAMSMIDSGSALSDTEEGVEQQAGGRGGRRGGGDETEGGERTDDELPFVPLPEIEAMGVGMRFMLPPTAPPMLRASPDVTMSPRTSRRTNRREFVGESPRPRKFSNGSRCGCSDGGLRPASGLLSSPTHVKCKRKCSR